MYYRLIIEGMKVHFVPSNQIGVFVFNNLVYRYKEEPPHHTEEIGETLEYCFDPGGSVMVNDAIFDIKIGKNLTVNCRAMHWEIFKDQVYKLKNDKYENLFYKLHGQYHCLVLTNQQKDVLFQRVKELESKGYDLLYQMSLKKYSEAIAGLRDRGVLVIPEEKKLNKGDIN